MGMVSLLLPSWSCDRLCLGAGGLQRQQEAATMERKLICSIAEPRPQ